MSNLKTLTAMTSLAALLALSGAALAAPTEIKGPAILEHACGKTSVKHMGLVNGGKMEAAVKLGTPEMASQWNAMSAEDRTMMSGMMKEMSVTEAEFSAQIKSGGVLAVDGTSATLTVKQEHKDANGSSTSTMTQKFKIDGGTCRITR
jgi:hypothetical protein